MSDNGPAIVGRITGVGNGFNFKLIGRRTRRPRVDLHPLMNRSMAENPDSPIGLGVTRRPGGGKRERSAMYPLATRALAAL